MGRGTRYEKKMASIPSNCLQLPRNSQEHHSSIQRNMMSFAPVIGPGSHTHRYLQSSVHACFASLAALCSSLLASIYASIDNLAARMPSAYCPVCRYTERRASKPTENTSAEDKITAVVFDPGTGFCTLRRLEDIDGEYCAAFTVHLSVPIAHYAHSGESHLPRLPSQFRAIHQSPAFLWGNQSPCGSC